MELSPYRERYNGYKRALEELGLTETSTLSSIPDNSFEYGFQCTEDLLEQNPNLDAIMAAVDIQGIGAMRALKEHCISIPDQIRLISLTGHFIGSIMPTTMTSMEMPARLMGEKATLMTLEEINAPDDSKPGCQHLQLSSVLAERESG